MKNNNKRVITILYFGECQYAMEDISFLLPGIIHRFFENDNTLFNGLIQESLSLNDIADKGLLNSKISYYENMADFIGTHLQYLGIVENIKKLLDTHYVNDAGITPKNHDLFISWEPRYYTEGAIR